MCKWILAAFSVLAALTMIGCGECKYVTGPAGPKGDTGAVGATGTNGAAGANGADGVGCSVVQVSPGGPAPFGGAIVTCASGSVLLVNGAPGADGHDGHDGTNGADGHDGADAPPTAFTIVGMIDPCGTQGQFDEVFLVLANGKAIASFSENSNGKNTRLWEVRDGIGLQTTDDTGCVFSLQTTGHTRTISWTGGSESWNVP